MTNKILELLIQDSAPADPVTDPPSSRLQDVRIGDTENVSETGRSDRTGSTPAKPAAEPEKEDLDFLESLRDSGRDAAAVGKIASSAVTKQTAAEDEEWLEDFLES